MGLFNFVSSPSTRTIFDQRLSESLNRLIPTVKKHYSGAVQRLQADAQIKGAVASTPARLFSGSTNMMLGGHVRLPAQRFQRQSLARIRTGVPQRGVKLWPPEHCPCEVQGIETRAATGKSIILRLVPRAAPSSARTSAGRMIPTSADGPRDQ